MNSSKRRVIKFLMALPIVAQLTPLLLSSGEKRNNKVFILNGWILTEDDITEEMSQEDEQ